MKSPASQVSLYLPFDEAQAQRLAITEPAPEMLDTIQTAELVAILMVLGAPRAREKGLRAAAIERTLAQTIEQVLEGKIIRDQLQRMIQANYTPSSWVEGLNVIAELGISLLKKTDLVQRDYLLPDGRWDFSFSIRHAEHSAGLRQELLLASGDRILTSTDQQRLLLEIESNLDESCWIQGFAGVGKTHLLALIAKMLPSESTLLIAHTRGQLRALEDRVFALIGKRLSAVTFGDLATQLLNIDRSSSGWRTRRTQRIENVTDHQVATWLNLQPVGDLTPAEVALICRRAVTAFCHSDSEQVERRHLPPISQRVTPHDVDILVACAHRYWNELLQPSSPEIKLPVRAYHQIKVLSQRQESISPLITHILLDESHELTPPMLRILERGGQAVISLGDEYQDLAGNRRRPASVVRPRNLSQSIRAGSAMETVLNPLIETHSKDVNAVYEGHAPHKTVISRFVRLSIPDRPATIIVDTYWNAVLYVIQFLRNRKPFRMVPATYKEVRQYLVDMIELYHNGVRPQHRFLFRFTSWQDLMEENHQVAAVRELDRYLRSGFSITEFYSLMESLCRNNAELTLGMVDHVKNQEFGEVYLVPSLPQMIQNDQHRRSVCSRLYVAASRTKYSLSLPAHMQEWLEDVKRQV